MFLGSFFSSMINRFLVKKAIFFLVLHEELKTEENATSTYNPSHINFYPYFDRVKNDRKVPMVDPSFFGKYLEKKSCNVCPTQMLILNM